jgi:hypothetical protein
MQNRRIAGTKERPHRLCGRERGDRRHQAIEALIAPADLDIRVSLEAGRDADELAMAGSLRGLDELCNRHDQAGMIGASRHGDDDALLFRFRWEEARIPIATRQQRRDNEDDKKQGDCRNRSSH